MQRKGMRELRKNSRQGVSLVIVLCVSAFFVAFAAAILYTAGLLTSQSTGRLKEERYSPKYCSLFSGKNP